MSDFIYHECYDWNKHEENLTAPKFAIIVTCGKESVFGENRADQKQNCPAGGDEDCFIEANGMQKLKTAMREDKKQEAEYKAIAVIQPVGFLEAVHHKVERRNAHDEEECGENQPCTNLLSCGNALGNEIDRYKNESKHAAVNEGKTFATDGVVRADEELGDKVERVKLKGERPVGFGKFGFAECERVCGGENDDAGDENSNQRGSTNAEKAFEEVILFANEIVVAVFNRDVIIALTVGTEEIIIEEIEKYIVAKHIANIEIGKKRKGKGNDKQLEMTIIDQTLNTVGDEWQQNECIKPHGVMRHNDSKRRKRIHCGNADGDHVIGMRTCFVQIVCHGQTAKTAFQEFKKQKKFRDGSFGEECYKVGERACEVVGV